MNEMNKKTELPIHMIFGSSNNTKAKSKEMPRVGQPDEPVTKLTRFGWVLMSPTYIFYLG